MDNAQADTTPLAKAATALAIMEVGEPGDAGIIWACERKWQAVLDYLLRKAKVPLLARHYDGGVARFEPTTEMQGAWVDTEELRRIFTNPPREAIEEFERKLHQGAEQTAREEAARRAAGRYTLKEAAKEIAHAARSKWEDVVDELKTAWASGELAVFRPGSTLKWKLKRKPSPLHPYWMEVKAADLNVWLDENESDIPFRFATPLDNAAVTRQESQVEADAASHEDTASRVAWKIAVEKQIPRVLEAFSGKWPVSRKALAWFKANDKDGAFKKEDGREDAFDWVGADGKTHYGTSLKTFGNFISVLRGARKIPD